MKETKAHIDELVNKTEQYVETTVEIARLKSVRTTARVSGVTIAEMVIWAVMGIFVVNLTIALALWLGHLMGAIYLGFLVVAGIYLLAIILLRIFRGPLLEQPIENLVIKNLLDHEDK
jgi:hypothetical protein